MISLHKFILSYPFLLVDYNGWFETMRFKNGFDYSENLSNDDFDHKYLRILERIINAFVGFMKYRVIHCRG